MKLSRQAAILELVRNQRVTSQEALREMLAERGFDVAQATLSRDIRELGLVKVPDDDGGSVYTTRSYGEPAPALSRMLPALYLGAEGVRNLLVVRTVIGGAQPLAVAIDAAKWPEVLGTIAGDDTILLILRKDKHLSTMLHRLDEIAGA